MENPVRVDVSDMARCRERRARVQRALGEKHGCAVVSFSMNIAGAVKKTELIERGFYLALQMIRARLRYMGFQTADETIYLDRTGCEMLCACFGDAKDIKRALSLLEEADSFGRLLDIDVIEKNGEKVGRGEIGLPPRACLLCGRPVAECAPVRAHTADMLFEKAERVIREKLFETIARRVGETAQRALLFEVAATPKPGLVDRRNSGAHRDMDMHTFLASAAALRPYFERCAVEGARFSGEDESTLMPRLRRLGLLAEQDMMAATGGVNTHMGAIYGLGILSAAAGVILEKTGRADASALLQLAGRIAQTEEKLPGARAEARRGFPTVGQTGLPRLRGFLARGFGLSAAAARTLPHLILETEDTNVLRRAGKAGAARVREEMLSLLSDEKNFDARARRADETFIRENLSPGGCADLLAFTLFAHMIDEQ